jgi:protein-tyrosine phosphatase
MFFGKLGSVTDPPLHVVFVCTGNRFRSALAEVIFRKLARDAAAVESFGTLEVGSAPPLDQAVAEAERLGYDLDGHHSRPLRGADLSSADLVVGFERHHVAAAVVDAGARRERSFTLPELLELLRPARTAREAIAQAGRARTDPTIASAPEVADPYGLPYAKQRVIADDVHALTNRLARALFPT